MTITSGSVNAVLVANTGMFAKRRKMPRKSIICLSGTSKKLRISFMAKMMGSSLIFGRRLRIGLLLVRHTR